MNAYFYKQFPSQLALLTFSRPNNIVREHIMKDDAVVFFGGRDWENAKADLSRISEIDRPKFILSLFMIVITDQCLYTHFRQTYQTWRQKTNSPKFGWSGLGPHNENPFKIIWAPERDNVVDPNLMITILPDFVAFMKSETKNYFSNNLSSIPAESFFSAIKNDEAYAFAEGIVVPKLKELL